MAASVRRGTSGGAALAGMGVCRWKGALQGSRRALATVQEAQRVFPMTWSPLVSELHPAQCVSGSGRPMLAPWCCIPRGVLSLGSVWCAGRFQKALPGSASLHEPLYRRSLTVGGVGSPLCFLGRGHPSSQPRSMQCGAWTPSTCAWTARGSQGTGGTTPYTCSHSHVPTSAHALTRVHAIHVTHVGSVAMCRLLPNSPRVAGPSSSLQPGHLGACVAGWSWAVAEAAGDPRHRYSV